ncbi:hypothetical protein GXP67_03535 [Rhodocytophaga rosea]|uniref:Uncharacterized protein n=1 Tax=Rhodocytophaga rosea TaxID=2704465 RepID=A0A6C0GCV4_9BACT|nr:hypothetical protein [Rhodocytophaga rosea]QHT65801.1 hypothetical protein GXP67_03535 [Rhodocytophaga rosea]
MKNTWLKLILLIVGCIIVALPDSNERLFSMSEDHGPSLQDAVGVVLILVAYVWLMVDVWIRREKLLSYSNSRIFKAGLFVVGLAYGLIIASVMNDYKSWWIAGIAFITLIHGLIFYIAFK